MVYQLNRPDLGKGVVVALRRPQSPYQSGRFALVGLDGQTSYRVTNLDTKQQTTCAGKQLLEAGLEVSLETQPGSALFLYERIAGAKP